MRSIFTLACKDFKILVFSPLFLFITGLCASIWSFTFLRLLQQFADYASQSQIPGQMGGHREVSIHDQLFVSHISFVNIIFLFAIPAITMRLISEEKKLRTYDLLLTSPITSTHIAVGKFLAGFGAAMVLVLVSLLYPLTTRFFAEYSMTTLFISYAGLALVTGTYIAVGLFASSLTDSVVLSVVMGVLFNLILWFISQGIGYSDNEIFRSVMEHMSLGQNFFAFIKGTFKLSAIVFFASCIGLFVFLSERVIESARWR